MAGYMTPQQQKKSKLAGLACSIRIKLVSTPPTEIMTTIGVSIKAKIIKVACTVSVQLTARKPPTKVYAIVAAAPTHRACA